MVSYINYVEYFFIKNELQHLSSVKIIKTLTETANLDYYPKRGFSSKKTKKLVYSQRIKGIIHSFLYDISVCINAEQVQRGI